MFFDNRVAISYVPVFIVAVLAGSGSRRGRRNFKTTSSGGTERTAPTGPGLSRPGSLGQGTSASSWGIFVGEGGQSREHVDCKGENL